MSSTRKSGCKVWLRSLIWTALSCLFFGTAASAANPGKGCRTISGVERITHAPGVFVGDMHGTVEAPAFATALVCDLLRSDRGVMLALEYPSSEQHYLEEFLRAGTDKPSSALLASPFWSRATQDGRTSRAMLSLLDWVRRQIASGARIRVVAFDSLPPGTPNGTARIDARDEAMAIYLRQELAKLTPGEFPIVLSGNVHVRKTIGWPFLNAPPGAEAAEPLGYRLKDLGYLHLNIGYQGGSLWTCVAPASCGVQQGAEPGPRVRSFSIGPSADPAYGAVYFVGPLTASPPAADLPTGK